LVGGESPEEIDSAARREKRKGSSFLRGYFSPSLGEGWGGEGRRILSFAARTGLFLFRKRDLPYYSSGKGKKRSGRGPGGTQCHVAGKIYLSVCH